jgi:phosphoglycerol transferase MdoB-like AlkP superfamily enzyme
LIAGPALAFLTVEYMIGNFDYFPFACSLTLPQEFIMNLIWYYMVSTVFYLATGRPRLSVAITVVFFLIFGLVDSYFFEFRGRVLFPSDLMATGTAANVISEYDLTPSFRQGAGTIAMVLYVVVLYVIPFKKGNLRPRWKISTAIAAICIGYVCLFFYTPFLKWTGFEARLWTSLWQTKQNGVVLNFTVNLRYSSVEEPDEYDEKIDDLINSQKSDNDVIQNDAVRPNIIAIMNESFCDLSVIGLETNEPCLPFIDSLSENTIKGQTYVSVFSGHTANSEYEFLTGNSISFLPIGTVAYQMFTHENDYSLARQLNSLGYYSIAMHPYAQSGWNRTSVYNRYDFDEMYFIDDFTEVENIREYCSDYSNYQNLINRFESHNASEKGDDPLFVFNITMQNHGGYSVNWKNLDKTVWLTGDMEGKYESVDMYLSLARESDNAFKALVEYFQAQDEPTIIVMFGDHHPGLSDTFYTDVFGQKKDTLSQAESVCLYTVPYVIWANYDIEEKEYGDFSLNYLSTVFVDVLGYPKTGYQKFLFEAMQELPVITRNFYRDSSGAWQGNAQMLSLSAQKLLNEYSILQYNGLEGGKNRYDSFFNLANTD